MRSPIDSSIGRRGSRGALASVILILAFLAATSASGVDTPDTLRTPANDADYVIITTDSLYECIYPLAVHREQAGLRVDIVYLSLIEEEFGPTSPDTAIREFVDYAYHNWTAPAPRYVLLNGDVELIPTHLIEYPGYTWPSDNWFVCVDGGDDYPDLAIGRFPGNTPYETVVMTAKTISYEQSPVPGAWRSDVLLVADDGAPGAPTMIFENFCERMADDYIPPAYHVSRVYLRPGSPYYGGSEELRAEIDEGCLLTNYYGHGSWRRWARETILATWSIDSLSNDSKLPILFAMTPDQDFARPSDDCMGEIFLTAEGKGGVAHWAPSGMPWSGPLEALGCNLYSQFFSDSTLGDILLESMVGITPIIVLQMALMGDPGLQISFPTGVQEEPSETGWWPRSVHLNISPNPFRNVARIDYFLSSPGQITLRVCDAGGRVVKTLVDSYRRQGHHTATWIGGDESGETVGGGVYFICLSSGDHKCTKKIIRLK